MAGKAVTARYPRHGLQTVRSLLSAVGGKGFGSIESTDGLTISVASALNRGETDAAQNNAKIRAAIRKLMQSRGSLTVRRIQDAVRKLDAYKTGLFLSSFRSHVTDDDGVPLRLSISNDAPYALYVHPKGTPKSYTIARKVIGPMLRQDKPEIILEIKALMRSPSMRRLIKMQLLAGIK